MRTGYEESEIPTGHEAVERWGGLDTRTRLGLVFGTHEPDSRRVALTALGFARAMRELGATYLILLAAGVTTVWVALALLTGTFTPLGLLPAFGFALGFGWIGRRFVALGLEKRAHQTLDQA